MDRNKLKRLMSILTAMAIIAMSFSGAFSVAAEDLYVVSVDDVTEAILEDHSETEETTLYDNDSYSVVASQGEGAINVVISAENVVKHENAEHTPGYWVGFAVEAPEGAERADITFGGVSYSGEDEEVIVIDEEGNEGIVFYINAGAAEPKTSATLQWLDEENTPLSDVTNFNIDLSGVTLDVAEYELNTDSIIAANIVDTANRSRTVCDENSVELNGNIVNVTTTKLAYHKNGSGDDGYWTGFAAVAPDGAESVKYTFGETEDYIALEDIAEGKKGISFYTDAANPKTNVKLQWFDAEDNALSNPIELTMNLDGVGYYKVDVQDITKAILEDHSETPTEELYNNYDVNATQGENAINVAISAENVVKHENADHTDGYWVGFAVKAPEGAKKADVKFREYEAVETVIDIDGNGTEGIAFYINAGAENPKTTATLQWLDENDETLSAVTTFEINLDNVTLDVIDYTPEIVKANIADYDEVREVYDADSYTIDTETTPGIVAISMTGLKEHTREGNVEGYWTGFAVEAPTGATQFKYAFGADKETLVWEAGLHALEDIDGDEGEKVGVAFITDANNTPKKYAMLQWFDVDGNAVTDVVEFKMNLDGVKLNWISEETVTLANSTGTAEVGFEAEQNDGVITVKYTADALDKHTNGDGTDGYWVGFAVEAPDTEAKAKVTFGEYSNDNMTLEDIDDGKKGVAFYTNAGVAYPKTEATLQWIDTEGNPISAPTTFIVDLTDVTLAELPYISAEDVSEAKIVDQSNTAVKPYSSYSVSAEADEDGVIVVDIDMKSLKSHQNGEGDNGYWTGFAVAAPEGAVTMRYAFAADKESLSMSTAVVETGVVTVDEVEKNGAAFYTDAFSTPKKYVRLQWFDENGEALTNATDFKIDLSGVKRYQKSGGSSGGSSSNYYTVKFDTNGGSEVAAVKVNKEEAISVPAVPFKDGFVFDGWYTDKELAQKYDFSAIVTNSFTLYAKWTQSEAGGLKFTDVKKAAWYYDVVKTAFEKGLMNGISETEFAPESEVTRGMFVTILYRAAGEPDVEAPARFTDVTAQDYFAKAVAWASANGVVNGITDELFAPKANITREQMATILYRYSKAEAAEKELTYADASEISDYAVDAVSWVTEKGIMKGNEDGTFAPGRNASRAETAAVFSRFLEIIK